LVCALIALVLATSGRLAAQPRLDSWWEWHLAALDMASLIARLGLWPDQLQSLALILQDNYASQQERVRAAQDRAQQAKADLQRLVDALLTFDPEPQTVSAARALVDRIVGSPQTGPSASTDLLNRFRSLLMPQQAQLIDWTGVGRGVVRAPGEESPEQRTARFVLNQLQSLRGLTYVNYYNAKSWKAVALYDYFAPPEVSAQERDYALSQIMTIFDQAYRMPQEQFEAQASNLVYAILSLFWGPQNLQALQAVGAPVLTGSQVEQTISHPGALWLLEQLGYGAATEIGEGGQGAE